MKKVNTLIAAMLLSGSAAAELSPEECTRMMETYAEAEEKVDRVMEKYSEFKKQGGETTPTMEREFQEFLDTYARIKVQQTKVEILCEGKYEG